MSSNYYLAVGNYVHAPTAKKFESIITDIQDGHFYVNGQRDPVSFTDLVAININAHLIKKAGFYLSEDHKWIHDALPGYHLDLTYDGVAKFNLNMDKICTGTFQWTHDLQNQFESLAGRPLEIKW